ANTGISGFIEPSGKIIAKTSLFEEAFLTKNVNINKSKTFYTKYGNIFVLLCNFLSFLIFIKILAWERK
ncbi:hypothetical protein MCHI_002664, partial [Candidatus Magnetoovum chiemensis]